MLDRTKDYSVCYCSVIDDYLEVAILFLAEKYVDNDSEILLILWGCRFHEHIVVCDTSDIYQYNTRNWSYCMINMSWAVLVVSSIVFI